MNNSDFNQEDPGVQGAEEIRERAGGQAPAQEPPSTTPEKIIIVSQTNVTKHFKSKFFSQSN